MTGRIAPMAVVVLMSWAGSALAQTDEQVAEAGRMFQGRCINCHQPPDLNFATDRAWLDQVNRTA